MAKTTGNSIRCSFCGRPQEAVKKIIAGPSGVFICDECVAVCQNIMETENFEEYDVKLKNILAEMRRNLATGHIPGIRKEQKCSGCSMKDLCMPSIKPVKDLQAEIEKIGKAEL